MWDRIKLVICAVLCDGLLKNYITYLGYLLQNPTGKLDVGVYYTILETDIFVT
jgi:hypothetical protein